MDKTGIIVVFLELMVLTSALNQESAIMKHIFSLVRAARTRLPYKIEPETTEGIFDDLPRCITSSQLKIAGDTMIIPTNLPKKLLTVADVDGGGKILQETGQGPGLINEYLTTGSFEDVSNIESSTSDKGNDNHDVGINSVNTSSLFDSANTKNVNVTLGNITIMVCDFSMLCSSKGYTKSRVDVVNKTQPANCSVDCTDEDYLTSEHRLSPLKQSRHKDTNTKVVDQINELIECYKYKPQLSASKDDEQKNNFSYPVSSLRCSCREDCAIFGDCCVDALEVCFTESGEDELLNLLTEVNNTHAIMHLTDLNQESEFSSEKSEIILGHFLRQVSSCELISFEDFMLIVNRCPEDVIDSSFRDKCEVNSSVVLPPVVATFSAGDVTFKNVYCALCYNLSVNDLTAWSASVVCEPDVIPPDGKILSALELNDLVAAGSCKLDRAPPSNLNKPRPCYPDTILSPEMRQDLWIQVQKGICTKEDALFCQAYNFPHGFQNNPHCARCLNPSNSTSDYVTINSCQYPAFSSEMMWPKKSKNIPNGVLIILDITGTYSHNKPMVRSIFCGEKKVFDPYSRTCLSLICTPGYLPYKGKCLKQSQDVYMAPSSQMFSEGWRHALLSLELYNMTLCDGLVQVFSDNFFHIETITITRAKGADDCDLRGVKQCQKAVQKFETVSQSVIELNLTLQESFKTDTLSMLMRLPELLSSITRKETQIHITNMINATSSFSSCPHGSSLSQKTDFEFTELDGNTYVKCSINSQDVYYPLSNVGFSFVFGSTFISHFSENLNNSVFICETSQLLLKDNCTVVSYWLNKTIQNGSRLLIVASGQYYDEGDFQVREDQVLVCSNFQSEIQVEQPSLPYLVLSWLFSSLSIVFLLLMLIIYFLFPELRTLPGKMTASLAATMMLTFLSNLFTLVELHHDYVCPCVAALSHLVTLAHFGWMSAIAVNMALTFGPIANKMVKSMNDRTAFLRYNLVVWGVSLCIVLTSVVLDLTHRDVDMTLASLRNFPLYGYPYCTWFSGPLWAKLAFIILPYFTTFIVNIFGFTLTLIGIQQAGKISEKLGKKSSKKARCLMYIKLSSAMGFSWFTSALVNIYPSCPVLPYISQCLVLLQGVLLFLSFMVNQRVHGLLLRNFKKLGLDRGIDSPSGRTSLSTTKY